MIVTNIRGLGATGYVPDCTGAYNPCAEIQKAKANSITPTASLLAKCRQYGQACYPGSGSYIPDCTGTYNPTTEIDKAYANNLSPTATLQAKAQLWVKTCGQGGTMPAAPVAKAGIVSVMARATSLVQRQPTIATGMPGYGTGPVTSAGAGTPTPCTDPYCTKADIAADPCGFLAWMQATGRAHNPGEEWDAIVAACDAQTGVTPAASSWLADNKGTLAVVGIVAVGAIILAKLL